MKLLIKFPTRNRKEKFFEVLNIYYDLLQDIDNTKFVITCDEDDPSMNNEEVRNDLFKYKNLEVYYGNSKTKVEAINNDLENQEFNIVLLASDDMIPQIKGYDEIIREKMKTHFPDTDGVLWFNDGYQSRRLNTLCVLGKKYYNRFNYIYHPDYKSLWCDNEFTQVSLLLGRVVYFTNVIIRHCHPVITGEKADVLYEKNDSFHDEDKLVFEERMKNNFKN